MPLNEPPRLLTGIALLFWGGLTGNAMYGLIAALMIEARSWISLRWNFSRLSYVRAWHFSVLSAALIAIIAWLNGMKIGKLHTLFLWAPLTLLPIALAQYYGEAKRIPLNTFSFFARRKMNHELNHGQKINPRMVHVGYAYLAIILLATSAAAGKDIHHFIGVTVILAICLIFNARTHGFRPVAWVSAFIILLVSSYFSHWAVYKAYHHFRDGIKSQHDSRYTSANEARTSIGRLGKLKLSPNIFWRMEVESGTRTPELLRTATYHHYTRGIWKHIPGEPDSDGFRAEARLKGVNDKNNIRYFTKSEGEESPDISGEPNARIVGEVDSSVAGSPIPLPHFTHGIGDLGSDTSESSLECNTLGTVKINNPDYHVISYSVWTGDYSTTEVDAPAQYDLQIPMQESAAIKKVCAKLGLKKGMPAQEILDRLRLYFNSEFTYTTHLTSPSLDKANRWTAIGIFLEKTRSGHCEYFASATTLILRECGIPTRYSIGFAVHEYDSKRKEWVIRGKHAHAWSRVWIDDHWEDADLTPSAWLSMEQTDSSTWQVMLADWWQLLREDFLIWRTSAENKLLTAIIAGILLGILIMWLVWKLWKSRQRSSGSNKNARYIRPPSATQTPLNKLEPIISRKIGYRPPGLPLCRWVMQLETADPTLAKLLESLTKLHSQLRFDPEANTELNAEAVKLAGELKGRLKKLTPLSQ